MCGGEGAATAESGCHITFQLCRSARKTLAASAVATPSAARANGNSFSKPRCMQKCGNNDCHNCSVWAATKKKHAETLRKTAESSHLTPGLILARFFLIFPRSKATQSSRKIVETDMKETHGYAKQHKGDSPQQQQQRRQRRRQQQLAAGPSRVHVQNHVHVQEAKLTAYLRRQNLALRQTAGRSRAGAGAEGQLDRTPGCD